MLGPKGIGVMFAKLKLFGALRSSTLGSVTEELVFGPSEGQADVTVTIASHSLSLVPHATDVGVVGVVEVAHSHLTLTSHGYVASSGVGIAVAQHSLGLTAHTTDAHVRTAEEWVEIAVGAHQLALEKTSSSTRVDVNIAVSAHSLSLTGHSGVFSLDSAVDVSCLELGLGIHPLVSRADIIQDVGTKALSLTTRSTGFRVGAGVAVGHLTLGLTSYETQSGSIIAVYVDAHTLLLTKRSVAKSVGQSVLVAHKDLTLSQHSVVVEEGSNVDQVIPHHTLELGSNSTGFRVDVNKEVGSLALMLRIRPTNLSVSTNVVVSPEPPLPQAVLSSHAPDYAVGAGVDVSKLGLSVAPKPLSMVVDVRHVAANGELVLQAYSCEAYIGQRKLILADSLVTLAMEGESFSTQQLVADSIPCQSIHGTSLAEGLVL